MKHRQRPALHSMIAFFLLEEFICPTYSQITDLMKGVQYNKKYLYIMQRNVHPLYYLCSQIKVQINLRTSRESFVSQIKEFHIYVVDL